MALLNAQQEDVKAGSVLKCINTNHSWWTQNKEYKVFKTKYGSLVVLDDDNEVTSLVNLLITLTTFKLIKN